MFLLTQTLIYESFQKECVLNFRELFAKFKISLNVAERLQFCFVGIKRVEWIAFKWKWRWKFFWIFQSVNFVFGSGAHWSLKQGFGRVHNLNICETRHPGCQWSARLHGRLGRMEQWTTRSHPKHLKPIKCSKVQMSRRFTLSTNPKPSLTHADLQKIFKTTNFKYFSAPFRATGSVFRRCSAINSFKCASKEVQTCFNKS